MSNRAADLKTYAVLLLFISLKAGGNWSLAWGMKQLPERMTANPLAYLAAMLEPFVAVGILALILAVLARMTLLSLADLSFVLPVTAVGYVLAVVIGRVFLHEAVSGQRWLGALLIFGGAALVSSTARKTPAGADIL
jgi:drug/metabolite transporter (DMT)-like permease